MYDKICDEREKRLDIEDIISDEKKTIGQVNKDLEYLTRRSKTLEMQVAGAEQDLIAFQVSRIYINCIYLERSFKYIVI